MDTFSYKKILFLALGFFLYYSAFSYAAIARLRLTEDASVGTTTGIDVLVDTEGQSINSIDMEVSFSPEFFEFAGYESEGGVVSLWVTKPRETSPGNITFSGVVPGGVERLYDPLNASEKAFPVVRLLFVPTQEGEGAFAVTSAQLLKNDGQGTGIEPSRTPIKVVIGPTHPIQNQKQEDVTPPLPFLISQIEGSLFGKTPNMITFEAVDEDTGIHHYEIRTRGKRFVLAQSPYELPHRFLPYTVTVRAFDFSGNYRDASITIPGDPAVARVFFIAIVGVLAIVIYVYRKRSAVKL